MTVITHPCGPWGDLSRLNLVRGGAAALTVLSRRQAALPIQKMVNDTIAERVKNNRCVFAEHPYNSQAWNQPEMKDVQRLLGEDKLFFVR